MIILVVLLIGCQSEITGETLTPQFDYEVSGCDEKTDSRVNHFSLPIKPPNIYLDSSFIKIQHDFTYVCCADIFLNWSMMDNTITVYEYNKGDVCFCLCDYNVNATVGPLQKGSYDIKIYGIGYGSAKGRLIKEKGVNIV